MSDFVLKNSFLWRAFKKYVRTAYYCYFRSFHFQIDAQNVVFRGGQKCISVRVFRTNECFLKKFSTDNSTVRSAARPVPAFSEFSDGDFRRLSPAEVGRKNRARACAKDTAYTKHRRLPTSPGCFSMGPAAGESRARSTVFPAVCRVGRTAGAGANRLGRRSEVPRVQSRPFRNFRTAIFDDYRPPKSTSRRAKRGRSFVRVPSLASVQSKISQSERAASWLAV